MEGATDQTIKEGGVGPLPGGVTSAEAAAMLRAVLNLFRRWDLDDTEARKLLGDPCPGRFERWKAGDTAAIPADTVERLGDLLRIHRALRSMFTEPERGYAWVRRSNAAFAGHSALDRMLEGTPADLQAVRDYLEVELAR